MLQRKWELQKQRLHVNLLYMRAVSKAFQGFYLPLDATVLVSWDTSNVIFCFEQGSGEELLFQLTS